MRTLLLLTFLSAPVVALESRTTVQLYAKIVAALAPQEDDVTLYVSSRELAEVLHTTFRLETVPQKADVMIVDSEEEAEKAAKLSQHLCRPVVFATSYRLLKYYPFIVGALYWKKGRVQLLFVKERLKRCGIDLPSSLHRYEIEAL